VASLPDRDLDLPDHGPVYCTACGNRIDGDLFATDRGWACEPCWQEIGSPSDSTLY